jgi:Undecaprenyl-phosphate galactose phosphotransferase WbaP
MSNYISNLVKNVFDFSLTAVGTICISPLLVYIAYRIKKEDPGPIFFAHERIGKNGKPFPCYKFRSMVTNSQEMLQQYLAENPAAKEEWEREFKLKDDPRVTPIGKVLRRTSLDELPQIFNVLRGEMSLVGPRPVIQEELDKYYGETAKLYCTVKPGITGLWQVSGRSDTTYDERVAMDESYINNRSFLGDIVILWKTIGVVALKKGAY